jgi:hypothetical protein
MPNPVMPGLVPGIHVFFSIQTWMAGVIGVQKHAVVRTAMPGHDN